MSVKEPTTLHEKLVAIQSDLKAPKGQTNTFGKYKYRSCEDILEAVKPHLKHHGLLLLLSDEIVEVGGRVYVKAIASVWIEKDTSDLTRFEVTAFARESEDKKGMDDAQITGAASSYARKYALNGLFCIDDTKDADTMDNTEESKKPLKATATDVQKIASLCKETKTDHAKLMDHFAVKGHPTPDQAKRMIVTLEARLSKQIDSETLESANALFGK